MPRGRPDFDKPTKNSLLDAKDYWLENLELTKQCWKDGDREDEESYLSDIKDAEEHLKDIEERFKEFD